MKLLKKLEAWDTKLIRHNNTWGNCKLIASKELCYHILTPSPNKKLLLYWFAFYHRQSPELVCLFRKKGHLNGPEYIVLFATTLLIPLCKFQKMAYRLMWSSSVFMRITVTYRAPFCIYQTPPPWAGSHTWSNFKRSTAGFEFRVFFLFDWLPKQVWRTHSVLLVTHSWGEGEEREYMFVCEREKEREHMEIY